MNNNYEITMDSFGENLPTNWEEIAAYLNERINTIIEKYGDDADYDMECKEEIYKLWEDYCNGEINDAPVATF